MPGQELKDDPFDPIINKLNSDVRGAVRIARRLLVEKSYWTEAQLAEKGYSFDVGFRAGNDEDGLPNVEISIRLMDPDRLAQKLEAIDEMIH